MAKSEGRGTTKNIFFKDQEMNFTVLRALMGVYDDGATIGECLKVVQNTKSGDIETFVKEWKFIGDHYSKRGDEAKGSGDLIRAREYYFRACNYYKSALNSLNPIDSRHREFWRKSLNNFMEAGALLEQALESVQIDFDGKNLPCFFLPALPKKKQPVLFLATGGEGTNMEMYFWAGAYALKNGYSVFLYCKRPNCLVVRQHFGLNKMMFVINKFFEWVL